MAKSWQSSETSYLNRYAGTKNLEELAQRFETDTATVAAKLQELGVTAKGQDASYAADPALGIYEKALKALAAEKWDQAAKLFEQVADESGEPAVNARASQYLAICRARQEEGPDTIQDDYLRAVFHRNRGEHDEAREICSAKKHRDDERFVYLLASLYALEDRSEEAEETLARAIELNPENRIHAFHDPDFEELRKTPELAERFGFA